MKDIDFSVILSKEVKAGTPCECAFYAIVAFLGMSKGTMDDVHNALLTANEACAIPGSDEIFDYFSDAKEKISSQVDKEMKEAGFNPDDFNDRGAALRTGIAESTYGLFEVLQKKVTKMWLQNLKDKCGKNNEEPESEAWSLPGE